MGKKRAEITFQTRERLVIRQRGNLVQAWCEACGEEVRMVAAETAAALVGISTRTIYRWIEAKQLHFTEPPRGVFLVCLKSLLKRTGRE
ncbi:MAG: hypothetical protein HY314_01115 [Acidobacteria bacterium]|nr:hypothetical protein [Acidobacteriota bacterium]